MMFWWLLLALFIASYLGTALLRRYALARSLMDIPNDRSSHSVPVPRGGGLAIVICFLASLPLLAGGESLNWSLFWALLGAGAAVALLGFLDDHGHIAARWRLLGHFLAAAWVLFFLGGLPPIALFGGYYDLGWIGYALAALYMVWLLNLYNFMDGIDGIASVEALCVCVGGALLYLLAGHGAQAAVPLLLATAVAGFLCWNFPPARIFMGDAGSGFLGVMLAALSLHAGWVAPELFWGWLILLGVFVVDATWTLLRRLFRGEAVYEAHRSHAYQFAARRYGQHLPVTLAVVALNLFWLLPWALVVGLGKVDALLGGLLAYTPLWWLALQFRAGERETLQDAV